jgi:hypothetical protein
MPRVPEYQPSVQERPIFQNDLSVRASPDAFGASVGRGMTQAAQGLSNLGDSIQAVRDLEDVARAKEADNAFANWARERMYGDGGFMTLEGRNAVDARKSFEDEAEAKRKEFGAGLTPGAGKAYQTASQARLRWIYEQSIVHTANERKSWFKDASAARIATVADDALVNYNNPDLVRKNATAGLLELREKAKMEGWDEDTFRQRAGDFVSGIHKNVALRIAQDDPLAADAYIKKHADGISGADQYALRSALDTEIKSEQSKREAEAILSSGRQVSPEGPASAPAAPAGRGGPTRAKAFLSERSAHKGRANDTLGLDDNFASNLAAMMQDAPPGIREGLGIYSGYRSRERQEQLWASALKRYGSAQAARRWVAPPGHSQHNEGKAVDLSYNGQSLNHAPREVVEWVHQNARKYGLYFPMKHEPWHVEPMGTRGTAQFSGTVAASSNTVAPRAVMPSYDDIENKLANISDPDVRDLTRKRIYAALEAQSKAQEQQEKAAKAELWRYVDQGQTPDQVPMEVRQAAGMAAVSSAWSYMETAAKGREVDSDQTLLYDMRRYAATNPTDFANIDLNDYRDRLSKQDIQELTDKQSSALTDQRKAREDGLNLTSAFSQAQSQLEAVGITTTGKEGSAREEQAKRTAQFQNALAAEMEAFKRANDNRNPTQLDIQSMINRLLLPVVIKEPSWSLNPFSGFSGESERDGFLFESRLRSDASTVDVVVEYSDIPIELRNGIALDLERELGRKPSEAEVVERYKDFTLRQ